MEDKSGTDNKSSDKIIWWRAEILADIDKQAKDMFFRLVKEYADRQGVTEQLKADKPLKWVQRMNNIRNVIEKVINAELIYT